jgi:hypothetical protein
MPEPASFMEFSMGRPDFNKAHMANKALARFLLLFFSP